MSTSTNAPNRSRTKARGTSRRAQKPAKKEAQHTPVGRGKRRVALHSRPVPLCPTAAGREACPSQCHLTIRLRPDQRTDTTGAEALLAHLLSTRPDGPPDPFPDCQGQFDRSRRQSLLRPVPVKEVGQLLAFSIERPIQRRASLVVLGINVRAGVNQDACNVSPARSGDMMKRCPFATIPGVNVRAGANQHTCDISFEIGRATLGDIVKRCIFTPIPSVHVRSRCDEDFGELDGVAAPRRRCV